ESGAKETFDVFPDSEASITTGRPHEELATRRGGRRRRRSSKKSQTGPEGNGVNGANGHDEETEVSDEPLETQAHEPSEEHAATTDETTAPLEAPQTEPRPRRATGRGRRRSGRHERGQPAITDLLREGQEILVQIAKEPIAKKGARITSHIALPGRYL